MLLLSFLKDKILQLAGFLFVILFSSCTAVKEFKAIDYSSRVVQSIDSVCMLQLKEGNFPGMAVAVAQKGNLVWSKGYGYSNIEQKVPVEPGEDLFRIGSISKTITTAALARLSQRKKIDLDVPVSAYYPTIPSDKGGLTLRQLGGHLAGIRHYNGLEFFSNIHYTNLTDPLEVFIHDTLLFAPGTKFGYSTYGWSLISVVMEKAAHEPFLDIIKKEVSQPLHLDDLKADEKDSTQYRRVSFYEFQNGSLVPSPTVDNSNKWAGGGFLCSAEEVAQFGLALAGPGYLKEKTLAIYTQSQSTASGDITGYGIGIGIGTDEKGRTWYGHSGGSIGGTSMLLIYPEEELVVVTLVNRGSAEMNLLARRIAEILFTNNRN